MIPDGLFLDAATPIDVAELLVLEKACFSHPWSGRHFADAMADAPRQRVLALRRAGAGAPAAIVAYCVFRVAGDELQVDNVAVRADFRGRGLGRWLMSFILDAGRRRGAREANLEVRQGNGAARRLYDSLGFTVLSTRRGYYRDPVEDALVMTRHLP